MRAHALLLAPALVSAAMLGAGCGPGATTADAGADAPPSDAPRPDAGVLGDTITFLVSTGAALSTAAPAGACAVSIVAPGPRRLEGSTEADGTVTLSGFSWGADGRISATFFCPLHSAFSISGFSRADYDAGLVDGRFPIFLPVRGTPVEATLHVTGNVTGLADPMDVLYAQPTIPNGTTSANRGSGFEVRVPSGVAFGLLFTDLVTSRGVDRSLVQVVSHWALDPAVGPLTADAVRDVDLVARGLVPTTSTASFVMPDEAFFRDPSSEVNVVRTGLDGDLITGLTTTLTVGADARTVDVSLSLVEVPGVTDARTVISVAGELGSSTSTLDVATPSGVLDARLLTPPTIDTTASRPLFVPVAVTGALPGVETRVRIEDATGGVLWTVAAPLGSSTVALPALPFETMVDALGMPGTPVYLAAQLCELVGPTRRTERCVRTATSARVLVAVP